MKPVHIGKIIKKFIDDKGINKSDLARRIETTPQNVYGILKRESIDTGLLTKINKALDFNFFVYYVPEKKPVIIQSDIKELEACKQEVEYLKEINTLLREKRK